MRYGRLKRETICGVLKKDGVPCQYKLIDHDGRCPYHGGKLRGADLRHWQESVGVVWEGYRRFLEQSRAAGVQSTGPRTPEGKAKVTGNLPWARRARLGTSPAPSQPGTPAEPEGKARTASE